MHVLEHLSFLSRTKHVHFFGTPSFLSTQVDRGRSSFQCWTHPFLLRLKVHEIWSTGQKGFHYTFNRTKDVELKQAGERQEGCLMVAHKYTYKDRRFVLNIFGRWVICKVDRIQFGFRHDPCHPDAGGRQFFLDGRTPHRVLGRGAALTLYVRGMEKPGETIARAESATPDWQGGIVSIFFHLTPSCSI